MKLFKMKYLIAIFIPYALTSCHFFSQEGRKAREITLSWRNREITLPTNLPCKVMGQDTTYLPFHFKKYKIFTYIDTVGCSACQFGALDWKHLIQETDSLTLDVAFLFYAHLKDYEEFETYTQINKFNYPIFYDYKGECNKQNHLPDHVFYQTFLLDETNKVLLVGKPKPGRKLWELYKKIITQ